MFTKENTTGYSQKELDALNAEWAERVADRDLEPGTDEYYEEEKIICRRSFAATMSRTIKTGEKAQLRIDNGLFHITKKETTSCTNSADLHLLILYSFIHNNNLHSL